jgi:uncharacterized protein YdeI (YjbR/CyaY-like superfamily)
MGFDDAEHVQFARRSQWREWLERNHATSDGVWVVTYKKAAGRPTPTYDDVVREALCFGWIDSRPGKVDDERSKVYVCPRKPGSVWAATNKARVEELLDQGLMMPAGQAVIDRAKADGSWSRIDSSEAAEIPDDLTVAFAQCPGSAEQFAGFPLGVRKQILQWIALAKRSDTRANRIDETARLAQQGIRANQWRAKSP